MIICPYSMSADEFRKELSFFYRTSEFENMYKEIFEDI